MISLGESGQVCRLGEGQEVLISAYKVLIQAVVFVLVPTDGNGGAAKILLKIVKEFQVVHGVVQDVQLIHHSSGVLPFPLQLFSWVSHFTAERV